MTTTSVDVALSDVDLRMLALERRWWQQPGAKEQAIRDQLALTPTRYYQLLGQLLDRPETLAHDPLTVGRLRRRREQGAARRAALRSGAPRQTASPATSALWP